MSTTGQSGSAAPARRRRRWSLGWRGRFFTTRPACPGNTRLAGCCRACRPLQQPTGSRTTRQARPRAGTPAAPAPEQHSYDERDRAGVEHQEQCTQAHAGTSASRASTSGSETPPAARREPRHELRPCGPRERRGGRVLRSGRGSRSAFDAPAGRAGDARSLRPGGRPGRAGRPLRPLPAVPGLPGWGGGRGALPAARVVPAGDPGYDHGVAGVTGLTARCRRRRRDARDDLDTTGRTVLDAQLGTDAHGPLPHGRESRGSERRRPSPSPSRRRPIPSSLTTMRAWGARTWHMTSITPASA